MGATSGASAQGRTGSTRKRGHVRRAALLVGVGLAVLQQVTGINTVIYYAPTIIEFTGVNGSSSAILASLGIGVVNIGMTVLALRLIDRKGRRTLLMVGVTGMVISLTVLGAAFLGNAGTTLISAIAIISLMTYVASFAISLGPVFWLMNSEIYPLRVRSKAAGVGTMANWTSNFVISLTFLLLEDRLRSARAASPWSRAPAVPAQRYVFAVSNGEAEAATVDSSADGFQRYKSLQQEGRTTGMSPSPTPCSSAANATTWSTLA